MSASNEQLGDQARAEQLREIIEEEEQRLGEFVIGQLQSHPPSPTLEVEQNWNRIRWEMPQTD